jgi:hypothetical protein
VTFPRRLIESRLSPVLARVNSDIMFVNRFKMRFAQILIIVSLVVSLQAMSRAQRNGGGVPVPVQWLRNNVAEIAGVYPRGREKDSVVKTGRHWISPPNYGHRCFMAWKADKYEVFLHLNLMNPQRVTVVESAESGNDGTGFWQLRMFATNKQSGVEWFVSKKHFSSDEIRLVLRNKAMAERFAKAFRDAFKECGGKADTPEPY